MRKIYKHLYESFAKVKILGPQVQQQNKVVVALYTYTSVRTNDLTLIKGAEYKLLDESSKHWWKVMDENGSIGYVPSNYVKDKELLELEDYDYVITDVGNISREQAETLLMKEDKEGRFVVRNSSTTGMYTLSLLTKVYETTCKHYLINRNNRGEYYLSENHCCPSIPELINYHKHNSGGLCSRLKAKSGDGPDFKHDLVIDPSEVQLMEVLGKGQFGVVRHGKWRNYFDVAVKIMKEGKMSEDDFIEEAMVMAKLQHPNLVRLFGVVSGQRPIYIVTEYVRHGSLYDFLHRKSDHLPPGLLFEMCTQVCQGMNYLEQNHYIHRDLAARNCLVGSENVVKVADFGLARCVIDDLYTGSGGTRLPIRWASPEAIDYLRFSSKSDVWAFGILMWEVYTHGQMPYSAIPNNEIPMTVRTGNVLEKPMYCPPEIYNVMCKCWRFEPEERPSFGDLLKEFEAQTQAGPKVQEFELIKF